ncbi:putative phosphoacetylglucosamine mutase [Coleophoma cylindrospora]|uniref:Phosphoacetylglucosamine mutase n=1 Tax=Coleophoma cylindrospora TaxID=1849047 RepID=A0A3D8SSJ0_9HELO|nr:putative phosphoacetylglucosamine mutase [Coleophoma cylindrospora]
MDAKILEASQKHPKPDLNFQYGTAGFRMKANLLDSVVFRVGLVAALRSRKLGGQTIGVMITASHNPPEDNGVKLVDPMGEMLEQAWEVYSTELANAKTEDVPEVYHKLEKSLKIDPKTPARVIYARDTRPSGPALVRSLVDALEAVGAEYTDYKLLTTPQLHYLTRCTNTEGTPQSYGEVSEKGYYKKLGAAFARAMKGKKARGPVIVDCANGVGGPKLAELLKYLPPASEGLEIKIVNDDVLKSEILNSDCGADYVKTKQRAPPSSKAGPNERCCSLDGDADRIIYYFNDPTHGFRLLDGDRIASLSASFIGDLVREAGLAEDLKIGVVQTAYANGASTKYVEKTLKIPVVFTPTGVKWLHHAATKFDVGVYFEANGHGTIVFSDQALKAFNTTDPQSPAQKNALETLRALTELINQTVGDALSDMLLVETILAHKSWTPKEWDSTYTDLPNRLVRVEVPDRSIFKTTDAERKLSAPEGVQAQIDALMAKFKDGRAFARPSGTEDALRVYAEAATRSEADDLATKVSDLCKREGERYS